MYNVNMDILLLVIKMINKIPVKVMNQYVSFLVLFLGFVCLICSFPELVRNKHYWPWAYLEFADHEPNKLKEEGGKLKSVWSHIMTSVAGWSQDSAENVGKRRRENTSYTFLQLLDILSFCLCQTGPHRHVKYDSQELEKEPPIIVILLRRIWTGALRWSRVLGNFDFPCLGEEQEDSHESETVKRSPFFHARHHHCILSWHHDWIHLDEGLLCAETHCWLQQLRA